MGAQGPLKSVALSKQPLSGTQETRTSDGLVNVMLGAPEGITGARETTRLAPLKRRPFRPLPLESKTLEPDGSLNFQYTHKFV